MFLRYQFSIPTLFALLFALIAIFTAQTDRTAEFQALCETYRTQLNADCEEFIENPPSAIETLLAEVTSGSICLVEEGQQEQETDACEILEKLCTQVVTCTASGKEY